MIMSNDKYQLIIDNYDSLYPKLYNYIYSRVKNSTYADDIISNTFIKMVSYIDSFRGESNLLTWAIAIARREIGLYFHSQAKIKFVSWDDFFESAKSDPSIEPEAQYILKEQNDLLLKALDSLSKRERHIIELKYFAGLKQREIAQLEGLTQSNVGIILHRAIEKLKSFCNKNS